MKIKKNRKPTSKEFQTAIQQLQYNVMATQSQVTNLTEIFSQLLEFNGIKDEFMEHLKSKVEKEVEEDKAEQQCIGDEVI